LFSSTQLFGQEWSAEQKEVWATVENLSQAWADGDYNKIQGFIAEDYRGWGENSPAPFTKKEDQPWAERWLLKNKIVLFSLYPFAIDIHGDIAIVFYSFKNVLEQKDGSEQEWQGKWTDIYRKIDGKWLLIADTGFDFSSSTN
jgi:ketosteroid isomerase-like protein